MAAKRFYIETFGCQMNEHDSEKIAGLLAHRGMVPAINSEEADFYILNTCSVREKAAQKVYSRLGEFRQRKKTDKDFLIGVVGCVAQQEGEDMVKKAPFVDLVVGTHLYHTIPDLLDEIGLRRSDQPARVATRFLQDLAPIETVEAARENEFRANITIMEGCNKRCSFCIVPFTRGKERNRPSRLILEEARKVLGQGYVEIMLLGQTVNSYRDPERRGYRFPQLLEEIAGLPGLRRLRFTSPHPKDFTDEAIAVIASTPSICDQIHLPLQSGSSRVLRRMRRQYSREWFMGLMERFNSCGRRLAYSTDMIVGFPGETEQDFDETLEVVKACSFESMFSFKYSPRPSTEAEPWVDDVPEMEKARRLMILQRLQREIQWALHEERYLGKTFEVLVEGRSRDGENFFGRTTSNKVVNFAGAFQPGQFVNVRITQTGPNSLRGEVAAPTVGAAAGSGSSNHG